MKKKISARKIIFISTLSLITIISVILTLVFVFSGDVKAIELNRNYGKYESNQGIYTKENIPTSNYISMTEAADKTYSLKDYTITISTPDELSLFSNKCDPYNSSYNSSFLGYTYKILNNIDCDGASNSFVPVGFNEPFSGTFDGNGFEIKNLNFINLVNGNDIAKKYMYSSDNDNEYYIQYFAMFSKNSGTIQNLGLISPSIVLSYTPKGESYIAPLVGVNSGTIQYCYHKMLESNNENSSGISSQGGFFISGLVSKNTSTITSVYSAVTILSQTSSTEVLTQAEIANENTGTITNAYFYDETITNYIAINGKVSIEFDQSKVSNNLKDADHPGEYCKTISILTNSFDNSDEFYTLKDYNEEIQVYLKNSKGEFIYETPILRGIKEDSGKTFIINNENEFLYMYELFNLNANFASSSFTYKIANDIDMSLIGIPTVTNNISATIISSSNSHVTIFNASISDYYVTNMGIDCYGLFPWFSGTLKNIDIVLGTSSTKYQFNPKESNNKKAYGALVGYLDGGVIDNCNVYISTIFNDNINEYSVGGVAGYVGSIDNKTIGTISNTVVNGTIENASSSTTNSQTFSKLGGAVGYIDYTTGTITNTLSTVEIISNSKCDLALGGLLGAGYINNFYNNQYGKKIDNTLYGNIAIDGSFKYASGLIGRLLGVTNQIDSVTNYGSITVSSNSDNESYLSGLMNVDIIKTASTDLPVSSLPLNNSGEYLFYASQLNSDCNIVVNGKNLNMHFTNGLNINTKNGFTSKISGLYNSTTKSGNTTSLLLNNISNFSALVNSICESSSSMVYLDTLLNSKNYTFTTSASISKSILVSGIANGKNINFVDIRNNGNLSFILSHTTENNPELIVNGVFEELSLNTTANNIYNAGNITVKDDAKAISTQATDSTTTTFETIDINIYASGICFKNLAEIDVDAQNPLKASYDNTLVGSLNNVINNGKILITSDGINESMSVYEVNVNTNQKQNSTQNSQTRFNGNIYFSGIAYLNSGIISNSFNLADIELNAYSRNDESIYAIGGICTYLGSQYSQIRDSANDGTLQLINISNIKKAKCYVGGIVGLNNYDKNSNTLNAIIAFTINYGTLVGFNGTENSIRSDSNVINYSCYVGGILSYGACNMVNVVNYGDIYGTEVVSSLISSFDLSIYNANSKFYLANTINYGKINLLEKYHYNGATFVEVTFKNLNVIRFKESALKYTTSGIYDVQNGITNYYYLGAMFGVVNFASRSYSNTIIRYVINFYNAPIVQSDNQINKPTTTNNNTIDTSTFITVYGSTDEFGGGRIKYAPMTSVSDESGNIGVFSKNFIFRRAIDKDKTAVNFETYLTDNYISDFFEFVNFDKINTVLLDKIGWRSIAYANAAETLAKNIELMSKFVVNDNLNKSSINLAFTSSTWVSNIDSKIISDFLSYSIQSEELKEQYDSIVENVIFGENYKSAITQDIRKAIIKNLIEYYDNDKTDYEFLLQDLLYDDLLAKVISGENADYQLVQNKIISLLNSANDEELRKTLTNYLEMLIEDDNNEKLKIIFEDDTNNYYLQKKIDLINTLLDGFSEEAIATMAKDLIENATVSDVGIKAYNYLNDEQNKETAKSIYAIMVTSNNTSEEYLNALNKSFKKYNIDGIEKTDIEISNFYTDCSNESTSTGSATSTLSTYINGKSISYKKDYTELWNIVKNNTKFQKIVQDTFFTNNVDPTSSIGYYSLIAKATEYNNTYQSNDAPSTSPLEASLNSTTIKGKMQVNTNYGAINNRFIYTPDSVNSTATYYYGPFDRDGKLFSDTSLGKATEKFIGKDIYNVQSASRIADFYAPVFISTNKEITENYIAASNSTADNKTIATFYWHDGPDAGGSTRNQWVSDYILNGKNSKDGINFLFKNQNTGTYIIDGYNFTPNWSTSINEDLNQDNGYVIDSTNTKREIKLRNENKEGYAYVTTKVDGYQNDGNNYYTHPLKDYYLKGYITTAIYTGIWYMTSIWQDANNNNRTVGCYLMSQDTNNAHEVTGSNNKIYKGVQTTQYTYYQLDDLIRLDGIRTKSIDNPNAKDDTEVAIISAIMTSLLSEDSYKEVIINAVTEYAINNDFTESQYSTANLLANSLISTDFASNALINTFTLLSESALKNIKYNDGSLLTELTKIVNESEYSYSNKKLLNMVGATDKVTFKKLLLATLTDLTIYNKSDGTSISNYDFTYLLYRYIDYLKENEIKDKEDIANYIVSNSNDLKILSELANTDWDSFIDMYDGNESLKLTKYPNLSTIENNYNTNYLNHNLTIDSSTSTLSKFGLYLASNFINQVNLSEDSSITVENPSILLVRASSGSVTITGDTTYTYKEPDAPTTDSGTSITVDTVSKSFSNDSYRAFYLSGGSYNISSNNCTISEILLIDREASFSCTSDSETTPTIDTIKIKSGKNADEKLLYTGAKYEDLNSFNINLFDNTNTSYKDKIVTALATLYATYKSTTTTGTISKTVYELFNQEYIVEKLKENSDYKYSDNDKYLTNYQYLIKLMAEADYDGITSVFGKLINSAPSDFVIKLLLEYNDYSINKNIMTEIIKAVEKSNSGTYSNVEKYIIAAYLGQDYLNNTQQLTKTKLYELLNNYQSGEYQFIENDTTIDPEKFIDFINHLGGSANIDGYGIFALASSQGIKNGKFIPDNLDLSELDKFKADGSSSWRGGEKNNDNNTSDENSVNYHFYVSMKQLKKSISTSIIEIDLKDNNNNILFANSNQISDSVESINTKTITYYLTKSQFDSIDNGSSFTIDKNTLVYASKAKFYIGIDNSFNLYSDTINSIIVNKANDSLSTEYKIKIEAEDESVVTIYDIKFVIIDVDSTYNLSDDTSLGSIGGDVTLTFTTTNPMLNNADLTPFITIKKDNTSYNYLTTRDEFKKYFSFYTTGFYQVVKQTVNGEEIFYTATIKFSVDQSLPFGDYTVSVDVGTKPSIKMTKNKNNKAEIEYIEFDHQAVVVSSSMASTILFGRTFNDNDFSIDNGIPNYLTDFRISSNATAEIKYEVSSITSGLRQFKVTYTITAEDGTSASYTHTLIEKEPFEGNYATVYKDGNIITIDTTNVGYSLENGSYIKASDALNISFARNEGTPSFRIYFNLNNFYIDSNTTFNLIDVTSPESNQGKSYLISSYAGLTASITDNCELGTYSYQYTYIDSLNREFYFPIVNITKDYSTDSLISNLTFISSNISLGSAYTRISPNDALVTNENTSENQEKYYYDENEKYYSDFTNNKVTISNGAINYSDASVSGTNYYILGTVSDVQLSDYAPTMKIDDYAQIYQYTTPKKLAEYNGNQESSDTSILQTNGYFDDGIVYLYVPFYTDTNNNGVEDDTDNHIVCLVKMTIANDKKILSTIYNASGVTDDDKIGNFKEGTELKNIHNPDYIENTNYRVSQYSGREGNVSLNMNYIGNPSDGHFWYVSYAVFSESYIYNDSDTSSINFYHISIVDLTNNIYFTIKVNVPSTFQNYAIYLTVSYITYDKSGNTINNTLSCYVIKPTIQNEDGTYTFTTQYDLAMLPSGYFKFYLELPHGYSVTYTSSKENRLTSTDSHYEENKGSYLPPSSVVPQQIELTFNVSESNNDTSNSVWGEGNTSAITKEAEYKASSQDSEESQN